MPEAEAGPVDSELPRAKQFEAILSDLRARA